MRLYYFDDSGSRKWDDDEEKYFVMGGIGIDAVQVPRLQTAVREAATLYGLPLGYPSELKFQHVGKSSSKPGDENWMIEAGLNDLKRRRALLFTVLRSVFLVPSTTAIAVAVDKKLYGAQVSPIKSAVQPLIERVDYECQSRQEYALVALDIEKEQDGELRTLIRHGSPFKQFHRLLDTIMFMPSEETLGVQVADLVAGSVARYLNRGDPGGVRHVWPYFYRNGMGTPNRYGFKIMPFGDVTPPPRQKIPWPEFDRKVHEYELSSYSQTVTWHEDGTPSLYFPARNDVSQWALGNPGPDVLPFDSSSST